LGLRLTEVIGTPVELTLGTLGFVLISFCPYGSRPGIPTVPGAGAKEGRQVRLQSLQTSGFRNSATYFSSMMFCSEAGRVPGALPKVAEP
jgi:hypothetical protein